jgi:hypothetical protein
MTSPNTTTQGAADPIQSYLNRGLRNYWYPVAPSWQVGDAPVGITRLGDQIVLWRDKEGQVRALEDCRSAGISAAASRAGITALKSTAAAWSRKCPLFRTARWKARSA